MPVFRALPCLPKGSPAVGPSTMMPLSDAGGLSQFGCFIHILPPGSATALNHWHEEEDELVYVLAGTPTLIEGETVSTLAPGDVATFKAGVAVGHALRNDSRAEVRLMVIGTRSGADRITYPDHDVILTYDDLAGTEEFRDAKGNTTISPYLK